MIRLYIYIYPLFFSFSSHIGHYRVLSRVPCAVQQVLISYLFYKFIYLFIYFWLCWVFASVRGLSPVAASGGHSSSRCAGLSPSRPLLLRSTGSRRAGSVVVAHGPSCSAACGILPDQGSNPCLPHRQADSQPPRHQGSPYFIYSSVYVSIPIYQFIPPPLYRLVTISLFSTSVTLFLFCR